MSVKYKEAKMQKIKKIIGILVCIAGFASISFSQKSRLPYDGGWSTQAVDAQNVKQYGFRSKLVKQLVNYHVFIPKQLRSYTGPMPTLIWLHGSFSTLQGIKPISTYFQKAMDEKKLRPMVIVFPHGLNQSLWVNSKSGKYPVEDVLVKEIIPDLKNHFNFRPDRVKPMIAGFSMGGYGAARLHIKYPELFSNAIAIAGGPLNEDFKTTSGNEQQREILLREVFDGDMNYYRSVNPRGEALKVSKKTYKPNLSLAIVVGDKDKTFEENKRFSNYLNKLRIKHQYTVLQNVDHNMKQVFQVGSEQIFQILNQQITQSLRKFKSRRQSRQNRSRRSRNQRGR